MKLIKLWSAALGVCVMAVSIVTATHAQTRTLTFGDGKAAFVPPPGFTTLTAEQLKELVPTADPRAQVIGDPARGSSVVYLVIEIKLPRTAMDGFRRYMTETYTAANPAIKWIANRLETVGGRDGIRMEFSDDRQMHHIALVGHVDDGRAVMMTYNTPIGDLARFDPLLRASIASIRITP